MPQTKSKRSRQQYIWQPLPSGIYSTRSGYNSVANLNQEQNISSSIGDFNWIKDVWSISCSPKMKVILWSIIQVALSLGENLQKGGISSDIRCPRCKEIESLIHILFSVRLHRRWYTFAQQPASPPPPTEVSNTILPWVFWSI